jgi:hypothetical protein
LARWGRRRGVESSRVMLAMMMRYMIVQETLKVTKWPGGMFGSFDRRGLWMLLDCGML